MVVGESQARGPRDGRRLQTINNIRAQFDKVTREKKELERKLEEVRKWIEVLDGQKYNMTNKLEAAKSKIKEQQDTIERMDAEIKGMMGEGFKKPPESTVEYPGLPYRHMMDQFERGEIFSRDYQQWVLLQSTYRRTP